jgi:hypothetical protein
MVKTDSESQPEFDFQDGENLIENRDAGGALNVEKNLTAKIAEIA